VRLLLIDAELYLYRAASGAEFEIEWQPDQWTYSCSHQQALVTLLETVADIRSKAPGHQPVLCWGDAASFRYGIFPGYKSNRKRLKKPAGYGHLIETVKQRADGYGWQTATLPLLEGDDVLGVMAGEGNIIASADKDMLTVPGLHLRGEEITEQTREAADRVFYIQALTGDATDGYPGCPKFGPVTAMKALAGCRNEAEMWRQVLVAYVKAGCTPAYALQMARCARILRPGEYDMFNGEPILWEPPT
jgi:DNA polymerase-1